MSDCPRAGKWLGCRFEPRFDLSAANIDGFESIRVSGGAMALALESLRTQTYVRDVCVRCGKTIERTEPTS